MEKIKLLFKGIYRILKEILVRLLSRPLKSFNSLLYWLLLKIPGFRKLPLYLQKTLAFTLTVLILFSSISSIFLYSPLFRRTVEATWFNDNWSYRKAVSTTIASNSSDISNLQMLLTVDTSTGANGIGSGKMQASCQDLRFTNTAGKILPYYIDSGCTTTSTKIWVMVDLVPKNTTTMTLYMYYGNPSAPTGSNSQPYFDNVVGLVGYWNMNEGTGNPSDLSVTGNTTALTIGGSGTQTTTAQAWSNGSSGQYGGSVNFDGNDDYVDAGTNTALNPTATGFTITSWFKLANLNDGQWRRIAGRNGSGIAGNLVNLVLQKNPTNKLTVGGRDSSGNAVNATTTNSLTAGVWYFGAGTFDGINKQWTVYLIGNGVNETVVGAAISSLNISDFNTGGQSFYIGKEIANDSSILWDGQIDDVKIYNTARTAAQILNDYNNRLPNGQTLTIASTAPTTVIPTTSIPTDANAEKAPSPVAYWKFDDGQGTNAQDSTTTNADGTLAGTTLPTWQIDDLCVSSKCLYFDGTTSKVTVAAALSSVQTVGMWVRPNSVTSSALIDLDGGTHKVTVSSGTISATGFTSPTIYVNGKISSTLTANQWNYVTVTIGTSFASTSSLTIGLSGSTYFKGFIDDVKIYPYARSAAQILADYNSRGNNEGSSSVIASATQGARGNLSDGLVGYWKMDEASANSCTGGVNDNCDSSGNGNDGAWNGDATSAAGKYGNGTTFDGTGDYVDAGTGSSINPTNAISFGGWFYIDPTAAGNNGNIVHLITTTRIVTPTGGYLLAFENRAGYGTNKIFMTITNGDNTFTQPGLDNVISSTGWYHIIGTYNKDADGTDEAKLYINGSLVATGDYSKTIGVSPSGLKMGGTTNVNEWFNGKIDDVRIYNRALSPQEVSALYNFAPGPKVYLKMDEGSGTAANDTSGNSNNGTVNSGTWTTGKYGKGVGVSGTSGSNVSVSDFGY